MIGQTLALAFGVTKAVDLTREVFERATNMTPRPYLKSVLATGLSVGAACLYADSWRDRLLLASGIAGTSAVLHEGHAVLSTAADRNKVVVLDRAARAAASAPRPSAAGRRVTPL